MSKLQKHQFVTYRAWEGAGPTISARVERVHRDGTVTVRALFELDKDGNDIVPGFLGYRYRMPQQGVQPVCP